MDDHFRILSTAKLLLCIHCKICVVPKYVLSHLSASHPGVSLEARRAIQEQVHTVPPNVLARIPSDVVWPKPTDPSIVGLPIFSDCTQCLVPITDGLCNKIHSNAKTVRVHIFKDHQWQKSDGPPPLRSGVTAQPMFKNSGWPGLFEITPPIKPTTIEQTENVKLTEQLLQPYITAIDSFNIARTITGTESRTTPNPWLEKTRWREHLGDLDHSFLLSAITPPQPILNGDISCLDQSELTLFAVCAEIPSVCATAFQLARPRHVGETVLLDVIAAEYGTRATNKPVYTAHKPSTIQLYSQTWVSIFCYLWRVWTHDKTHLVAGSRAYPVFHFSSAQTTELAAIRSRGCDWWSAEGCRPEKHFLVLRFFIALLDDPLSDNEYCSPMLSSLAVLGINPSWATDRTDFLEPEAFTATLSAVVTVARVFVIYLAYTPQRWAAADQDNRATTDLISAVSESAQRFLRLDAQGGGIARYPLAFVLRLRTYGRQISSSRGRMGDINWRGSELLMGPINFTLESLREMIHGLATRTKQHLEKELLLLAVDDMGSVRHDHVPIPPLDIRSLYDQPAKRDGGWNFLQDSRNREHLAVGDNWLLRRVAGEAQWSQKFLHTHVRKGGSNVELPTCALEFWRYPAITDYFHQITEFKERMMVLIHLTSGQPARGTELTSIHYTNGVGNDLRSIFIEGGMVATVTQYHKTIGWSGRPRTVYRYCPDQIGNLLVYYLWLVQPFEHYLTWVVKQQPSMTTFLWLPTSALPEDEDGSTSRHAAKALPRGNEKNTVKGASTSWTSPTLPYHPGMSLVINKLLAIVEETTFDDVPDHVSDDLLDDVSGDELQTVTTAENRNLAKEQTNSPCDGCYTSNRIRKLLQKETLSGLGVSLGVHDWRHACKAIMRRYIGEDKGVERILTLDDVDELNHDPGDHVFDLQSGHTSSTSGLVYARDEQTPFGDVTWHLKRQFRQVSIEWHRVLGFTTTSLDPLTLMRVGETPVNILPDGVKAQGHRLSILERADPEKYIASLTGIPNSRFRSVQKPVFDAILQGKRIILAIMPTGSGKSMCFMLPTMIVPDGLTVVVVPLVSLRQDMMNRCRELKIKCAEWDKHLQPEGIRLLFVTPEAAVSDVFSHYLDRQHANGQLDRIVIDEVHDVLSARDDFRRAYFELKKLLTRRVQIVLITGTLPPSSLDQLCAVLEIPLQDLTIIRDSTVRPSIMYSVVLTFAVDETIQSTVADLLTKYAPDGQIVVYTRTRNRCVNLAKLLNCPAYHGELRPEIRSSVFDTFMTGKTPLLVSTKAFGMGANNHRIRAVIHDEPPSTILDFAQESGRCSRDGRPGQSIIISLGATDLRIMPDMWELCDKSQCRRVPLSRVMDGDNTRTHCVAPELACNICSRHQQFKRTLDTTTEIRPDALMPSQSGELETFDWTANDWTGLSQLVKKPSAIDPAVDIDLSTKSSPMPPPATAHKYYLPSPVSHSKRPKVSPDRGRTIEIPRLVADVLAETPCITISSSPEMLSSMRNSSPDLPTAKHLIRALHSKSSNVAVVTKVKPDPVSAPGPAKETNLPNDKSNHPTLSRMSSSLDCSVFDSSLSSMVPIQPPSTTTATIPRTPTPISVSRSSELQDPSRHPSVDPLKVFLLDSTPQKLDQAAARWAGCVLCRFANRGQKDHQAHDCPYESSELLTRPFRDFTMRYLNGKVFPCMKYQGCFKCRMPQAICQSWVVQGVPQEDKINYAKASHDGSFQCQYLDMIKDFVCALWILKQSKAVEWKTRIVNAASQWSDQHNGRDQGAHTDDSWETFKRWATVRINVNGIESNRLAVMFFVFISGY